MKLRRRIKGKGQQHIRVNKHVLGQSIAERPADVDDRTEIVHWEGKLVKGQQAQDDPAGKNCKLSSRIMGLKALSRLLLIMAVSLLNCQRFKGRRSILLIRTLHGNAALLRIIID